jgi:mono/diheme cytochrome c family protein
MVNFFPRVVVFVAGLMLAILTVAAAQEKQIKKEPVKHTSAASGEQMYKQYCAACHGMAGKGDGPAASALKSPMPDLTTLARRNNGKFPSEHVTAVLRFGTKIPAHGSADMPIWGPLLQSLSKTDSAQVTLRITNLVEYLKSLQAQ